MLRDGWNTGIHPEEIMACLSRHKQATSMFWGMAKNCNNLPQFKNLLELQVR